jgi:hypothetical protein
LWVSGPRKGLDRVFEFGPDIAGSGAGAREQEETFVFYEAPKRRSPDRTAVTQSRACSDGGAGLGPLGATLTTADPDTDPTAALLLWVDPTHPGAVPTPLLALADAALRSPR